MPPRERRNGNLLASFDEDEDDEDDDDDYIDETNLDTSKFKAQSLKPPISFGPVGRSAPSQRKAMGKSGSGSATVYVCTSCSAEFVKWIGRCPTCKEWNTVKEFKVRRGKIPSLEGGGGSGGRVSPVLSGGMRSFSSQKRGDYGGGGDFDSSNGTLNRRPSSWLTGVDTAGFGSYSNYQPIPMTDVLKEMSYDDGDLLSREKRIQVPCDGELNTVLGGGIMPGSLILLGGDPGVGKSTLLLQVAGSVASLSTPPRGIGMGMDEIDSNEKKRGPVLYVSGEENSIQIASRAKRLGIDETELLLLCDTDADSIADFIASYAGNMMDGSGDLNFEAVGNQERSVAQRREPSLVIIDSIQTMLCESGGISAAGGVTQVRECVGLFLRLAKSTGIPIFLVGHVTKSGDVAGPRTVEHMVDAVLYLEGDRTGGGPNLRMLRAAKNRFGSSDEVGVYEMDSSPDRGGRLVPVSDPSSLFLANRIDTSDSEGCAVSLVVEGLRPMAVEVQALVSRSQGNASFTSRRTVQGISNSRLLLILAVLQKRCGISFHRQDVFVNVVGGVSLVSSQQEGSGSDLAVAIALVSSLVNVPIRSDTAFVGEIGLLGEIRSIPSIEKRISEARRMGFSRVVAPKRRSGGKGKQKRYQKNISAFSIDIIECENVLEAINQGMTLKLSPKMQSKKGYRYKSKIREGTKNDMQSPGSVEELHLDDDIITDDEDDDIGFE